MRKTPTKRPLPPKLLRARKAELRVTLGEFEGPSGVNLRTPKRLINHERAINMGHFIKLAAGLDRNASEVVQAVADRVETRTRLPFPVGPSLLGAATNEC
jgi:hypothetical protein